MSKNHKKIPTVVLDIDDTVSDFIGFLCRLFNRKHNTAAAITESDLISWNFKAAKVEDAQGNLTRGSALRKFFNDYEAHGLYAAVPPFKESVLAMELIRKLGYKIVLLTARNEQFRKDTEINLSIYQIPHDEIIFSDDKAKHINRLARRHHIVAFVDDKFDHILSVHETDKVDNCYLINKRHNSDKEEPEEVIRIGDLLEIVRHLPDMSKKEILK